MNAKMILREYREQLYYKRFDKKEKGRNSVKGSLSELSQENTEYLRSLISREDIELVAKILLTKATPGTAGLTGVFYKIFQEEIAPNLCNSARKVKRQGFFSMHPVKQELSPYRNQRHYKQI